MASIAGRYQLSKLESVSYNTGEVLDITSTLTSCELSGIYYFKNDNTATYTELVNCNGNGSGTWSSSDTNLFTAFDSGNGNKISGTSIINWDCTHLVLLTRYPSVSYNNRYTLTKR